MNREPVERSQDWGNVMSSLKTSKKKQAGYKKNLLYEFFENFGLCWIPRGKIKKRLVLIVVCSVFANQYIACVLDSLCLQFSSQVNMLPQAYPNSVYPVNTATFASQ